MSQQIVRGVDERYPDLLQTNTYKSCANFCVLVCEALGPDWMLIRKSVGEKGYTWPNGVRTSHDAICRVDPSGRMVEQRDVIDGAAGDSPAKPSWGNVPSHEWRPSNTPVELRETGDRPQPNPEPPRPEPPAPTPPAQCACEAQMATLMANFGALVNFVAALRNDTLQMHNQLEVLNKRQLEVGAQVKDVRECFREGLAVELEADLRGWGVARGPIRGKASV